jgi:hypothetical protein
MFQTLEMILLWVRAPDLSTDYHTKANIEGLKLKRLPVKTIFQ